MSPISTLNRSETKGRSINAAVVQLDATPSPTKQRLARAERQIKLAVQAGAELVVLPEYFNTGFSYSDENHDRVESADGPTVTWLCHTAVRENIHLAGSLMLLDHGEVYNSLLLFSPDGHMWRYDKNYPFGWERGSFRETRLKPKVTIAKTRLGNIGFLICWDAAHLNLWESYAGQIDMMVISSCSVDLGHGIYSFPNGDQITLDDLGSRMAAFKDSAGFIFGDMVNQQTAWLGVPMLLAGGFGNLQSRIPHGRQFWLGYMLFAPWLLKYLPQADRLDFSFSLVPECKVVSANGQVLTRLTPQDGEAFAAAELTLAESQPKPDKPQPESQVTQLAYFSADVYMPMIAKSVYREGKKKWRYMQGNTSSESKSNTH
jgi:hypothetical protein